MVSTPDYTLRALLHRRLDRRARAGPTRRAGRILYGTGFEFLERFGLTSLDDLPPLDAEVAARLVAGPRAAGTPLTDDARRSMGRRPAAPTGRRRPDGRPRLMPTERIQKVLAAAGVASRRGSEALIAAGRVTVDGRSATLGQSVDPGAGGHRGRRPRRRRGRPARRPPRSLHKPAGVTSTTRDRHAATHRAGSRPARPWSGAGRLYPVGRLDLDSEGLILLTNDGAWADRVLHPRFGVEREYAIGVTKSLTAPSWRALRAGIPLDEGLATLGHLRPATGTEIRRLAELLDPPPAPAGLVSGHPASGLEAPAAPDVRGDRRTDRAARPGPARARSASGRCRCGTVRPLTAAEVRSLGAGRVTTDR